MNAVGSYGKWAYVMMLQVSEVNAADNVQEYRKARLPALERLKKSLLHEAFHR